MSFAEPIPVVDLFAGPGGLGEGFSSLEDGNAFRIIVSAEMEASAHKTLRLRAFYRILRRQGGNALDSYYSFCNGESKDEYNKSTEKAWMEAGEEAQLLTLGTEQDNLRLNQIIEKAGLGAAKPWILIGGPPCQAYSLVGRARNRGKANYCAEDDHRHFLYREYLKIIQQFKPAIFVMENVKGILSSKIEGKKIFHSILRDLCDPDLALGKLRGIGYKIHSLAVPTVFDREKNLGDINVHDFIVRAEDYGIPQARHRVILLGIREDLLINTSPLLEKSLEATVADAIGDLPRLRSCLSKEKDSAEKWSQILKQHLKELHQESSSRNDLQPLAEILRQLSRNLCPAENNGALRLPKSGKSIQKNSALAGWYEDNRLYYWLNHEARGHMSSDLRRYLYASSYARAYGVSPKGHEQFDLKGLRPNHENWETGKFADRFRVQLSDRFSTTVTSHISKDGHYFIHPDPSQCRSLTVREAARLQTFPDNYFFQGNRTQQFHQVGNAVPPLLAFQIAREVLGILRNYEKTH